MKEFFRFIYAWIKVYIINPVLQWWNFHINHAYIPDNKRNHDLMDFMCKVIENPEYEPSTPNEIYFEGQVKEIFEEIYTELPDNTDKEKVWQIERIRVYIDILDRLLELRWIDDSNF